MQTETLAAYSTYAKQLLQEYSVNLTTEGDRPRMRKLDMAIYKMEKDLSARKADMMYDIRYQANLNELEEGMARIAISSMNELLKQYV